MGPLPVGVRCRIQEVLDLAVDDVVQPCADAERLVAVVSRGALLSEDVEVSLHRALLAWALR